LVQVFCARLEYEPAALRSVLHELETQRLVQRDGNTYRGDHYALTFTGKQKVKAHRIRTGTDCKLAPEAWQEHGGDFFTDEDVAEMLCLAVPVPRMPGRLAA
jgi:hypothetical protein